MKNFEKQSSFLQNMMSSFEADWKSPPVSKLIILNILFYMS